MAINNRVYIPSPEPISLYWHIKAGIVGILAMFGGLVVMFL